ncbi:MAG: hypothetical protein QM602_03335 [Microbacterium sp.]
MSDLKLDFAELQTARTRVATSLSTFQSAGTVGHDVADLTGEYRLAGKVRDFADNWDANRAALQEQLEFLRDALDAVIDTMNEVDAELEQSANEAAPDTQTDDGTGEGG